jgi:hypothetical protein
MKDSEQAKDQQPTTMADLVLEMYNQSMRSDRHYATEEMSVYYRPFVYTADSKWKKILRLVKIIK